MGNNSRGSKAPLPLVAARMVAAAAVTEQLHWNCLWNIVDITHSSSSNAGHGWAIPFVWEARGALTRLLSACPGPAWGRWCHGDWAPLPQLAWRGRVAVKEICFTGWGTIQHDCKHLELILGPQKMFLSLQLLFEWEVSKVKDLQREKVLGGS